MFKKNLVIGVGGVISLLIFMVVAGVLILALSSPPVSNVGEKTPAQAENAH
jgi:hypothetical protein